MSKKGPLIKASPARLAALRVGRTVRERRAYTQDVISAHIDEFGLSPEDRAFAIKLSLGVVSSQGTLDEVIDRYVNAPASLQPEVRDALRISVYEILFLDKSTHAAVDQGVELVKSVTVKASGLANAVLRKVVKAKEEFPFGDPALDGAAFARSYAFPSWLTRRLVADLGKEQTEVFMRSSNDPAPVFISLNTIKTNEAEVIAAFKTAQTTIRKISVPKVGLETCYRVDDPRSLTHPEVTNLFSEGRILVSDAASQMISYLMLPDIMPASFLEIGAGRGTKTILLQNAAYSRYGKQMDLSVLDSYEFKIKLLEKRVKEYAVAVDHSYIGDATKLNSLLKGKTFDAVFIDAPCSGLGTLRRHPEIRWRLKPDQITSLAVLGSAMLGEAAAIVNPGGTLIYSTCTVTKEENQDVVAKFLSSEQGKEFSLSPVMGRNVFSTSLSPGSSDAHFAVRLVRQS